MVKSIISPVHTIFPNHVEAKLMADQGMADAVVPLPDDCPGFQICVDCRMYQDAKEAQQPYGVSISNH
jgi:hypothetical protein